MQKKNGLPAIVSTAARALGTGARVWFKSLIGWHPGICKAPDAGLVDDRGPEYG